MTAQPIRLATGMNSGPVADVLRTISIEGTAVSVWHRSPPTGLQAWLDRLAPEHLPALRTLVAVDAIEPAILAACSSAGAPDDLARKRLAQDVAALARLFSEILSQPFLRLSLETLPSNVDHKFSMAIERACLFCSYRGRGLQFGAARPTGPPEDILELPTGSAAVFRGALWPSKQFPGIVHRRPPLRDGESALLLAIAPVDEAAARC